jgi:hypothetical protein
MENSITSEKDVDVVKFKQDKAEVLDNVEKQDISNHSSSLTTPVINIIKPDISCNMPEVSADSSVHTSVLSSPLLNAAYSSTPNRSHSFSSIRNYLCSYISSHFISSDYMFVKTLLFIGKFKHISSYSLIHSFQTVNFTLQNPSYSYHAIPTQDSFGNTVRMVHSYLTKPKYHIKLGIYDGIRLFIIIIIFFVTI